MSTCSLRVKQDVFPSTQAPRRGGRFINQAALPKLSGREQLQLFWRFFFEPRPLGTPKLPIPVQLLTQAVLAAQNPDHTQVYRLGHSSLLLHIGGRYWLTDPVFAKRASPFAFIGPKRFHAPPLALEDLPPLAGVILSHNHYDHLDKASIKALINKSEGFYMPLGVGASLRKWGVPEAKIHEFDWWQERQVPGLRLVATPSQHFSGRGLADANQSLWCSWVLIGEQQKIFFSGDSGYFAGFAEIGRRFGPFDLTLMEAGAYDPQWAGVHMLPEESVQAHLDLGGKVMMPIHNGTFDLAFHAWYDPFEQIWQLAKQQGVALALPQIGEPWVLEQASVARPWWRSLLPR